MNKRFKDIHAQLVRFHAASDIYLKVSFKAISFAFSKCRDEGVLETYYDAIDREMFELLEINRQINEISSRAYKKGEHFVIMEKELRYISSMMNKATILKGVINKCRDEGFIEDEIPLANLKNASEIIGYIIRVAQISIVVIEKALNASRIFERIDVLQDSLARYFKSNDS